MDDDVSAEQLVAQIIVELESTNGVRERALSASRGVIRASANAIRAAHRLEFEQARTQAADAARMLGAIIAETEHLPALAGAGYVQDAMKEVAEAHLTISLMANTPLPSFEVLSVSPSAWLNGLGEAASELRRVALDSLRRNEVDQAEHYLHHIDAIYAALVLVDYPDAITGGIRRTTDQLRAVLERTRGDVTFAIRQDRLEQLLSDAGTRRSTGNEH